MKKTHYISILFISLMMIFLSIKEIVANNFVEHLLGKDRYNTSLLISKTLFKQAESVVMVNGMKNADMTLGESLAYKKKCPLILINNSKIDDDLMREFKRLNIKKVYIIGGPACISNTIEKQISKIFHVERFGGIDRFETSNILAKSNSNSNNLVCFLVNAFDKEEQIRALAENKLINGNIIFINKLGGPKKNQRRV